MPAAGDAPWLIYALGGGWGHLTRAVALAQATPARILTNSPYAARVRRAMPELDLLALDPNLPIAQARIEIVEKIRAAAPACLIVDTFPRGLGGELAGTLHSLAPMKVLVHRDLNPHYVATAHLKDFVRSHYDLILIPGENEGRAFADLPAAAITAPWLVRPQPRPIIHTDILICAAGPIEELTWYGAVAAELQARSKAIVRCVAPICPPDCPAECWLEYWPAADLIAAADVVIGGAGYNTIHECLAYNVPLIARPWLRAYDRQWLRARRAAKRGVVAIVDRPDEAATAALRQLRRPKARAASEIRNGADQAVARISACRLVNQPDNRRK
ncbi:MAG TPA: glycosyltransferase [Bryobacteraceae bacterium]|nr:glycosyltransferase [Bryobacteraceae bacterium]